MINTLIALMAEFVNGDLPKLTDEQAESLAKKVVQGTLPADFTSSRRQVRQWIKEIKAGN